MKLPTSVLQVDSADPRTYTKQFGMKMASLLPKMLERDSPQLPLAREDQQKAVAEFANLWGDGDLGDLWEDAGLPKVARYIFSAKGLRVPKGWEWLIPTSL